MARVTIVFGVLLILLGIFGYVATGNTHPTALIPCAFGLLLAVFGWLAQSPEPGKRKLYMHVAVTVGLSGVSRDGHVADQRGAVGAGEGVSLSRGGRSEGGNGGALPDLRGVVCAFVYCGSTRGNGLRIYAYAFFQFIDESGAVFCGP